MRLRIGFSVPSYLYLQCNCRNGNRSSIYRKASLYRLVTGAAYAVCIFAVRQRIASCIFLGNFVCRPLAAYYLYDGNNFLTVRSGYCAKAHRIIRQLVKGYVDLAAVFAYAEASRILFISERLCGIAVRISRFRKAIGSAVRHGRASRNLEHRIRGNGGKQYIVKLFFEDYGYILPAVSYGECSLFRFTFRCGNRIGICAVFEQIAAVLLRSNGFFTGLHR